MVKKSFIQSIADKNAKVNTLCEYLGTLRTECIRTYQSVDAANTHNFSEMHEIYTQISELSDKLNRLLSDYVLSDSTTRNVTRMYNEYLSTLDSVRKERGKREKLADRKARLLAELAALEEEESK